MSFVPGDGMDSPLTCPFLTNDSIKRDRNHGTSSRARGGGVGTQGCNGTASVARLARRLAELRPFVHELAPRVEHSGAAVGGFGPCRRSREQGAASATSRGSHAGRASAPYPQDIDHMGRISITWAAHGDATKHEICGFYGITEEMFDRVYGHHHHDYQGSVVDALTKRPTDRRRDILSS